MSDCRQGEQAIVYYQFPGQERKIYLTTQTPVNIGMSLIQGMPFEFTGYRCNYSVDERQYPTGEYIFTTNYIDDNSSIGNKLIYCEDRYIYPPFEAPILEWYNETGFSGVCRFQDYGWRIYYRNEKRERKFAYFSLQGAPFRDGTPNSNCPLLNNVFDVYYTRADDKPIPGKWQIRITDGKGNSFLDYGDGQPTYSVGCGGCPPNYLRCDDPNNYPGYTCVPCSSFTSDVRSIRSLLSNNK